MLVEINEEALLDLEEIRAYIAEDSTQNADRVIREIFETIEGLKDFPESGSKLENHTKRRNNYRFKVIKTYLIFYKIEKEIVRVFRILSGLTQYLKLLDL